MKVKVKKKNLKKIINSVPCDGCTICCQGDTIILKPHFGDKIEDYQTVPHPDREGLFILDHKENGDCIYLGAGGCTIHGKAPLVCREFDCRALVKKMGYFESYQAVQHGFLSEDVLKRAIYLINLEG